ncbi:HNH endonuclease [Rhodococcus sp. USK10]|uniref:HNH endonuclease n=1 Tax=Rhodococcus TaxID=1827 RepID=UPI000F56456C|nr:MULTISPECIES: HNH endonuclease domain-containing protein [Rhodococcus]QYB05658.1 HNH endonuclease [Rhodococcus sp. USK10]
MTSLDPVDVAGRVVQLLESGRRESTYKLATLLALVDICVENRAAPDGSLMVPINEITHRIVAYYWPQVRVFNDHGRLSQNKSGRSVPDRIAEVRIQLATAGVRTAEAAREAEHPAYVRLIRSLRLTVAQQPLTHLQTVPHVRNGGTRDDFLFDASRFHKKMTVDQVDRIGTITLRPGIPEGLRRTSALLRAFIRSAWTQDVVTFNRAELDAEDLDGFLFGTDRTALRSLVEPLRDLQDDLCFYCGRRMASDVHIDHVMAWSVIPIDGVANLVAADSRCNLDKSASIPVRVHVDRALERSDLSEVARTTRVPLLHRRTSSAADGVFGSLPSGSLLWRGVRDYESHIA